MKTCIVEGCTNRVFGRSYCKFHQYLRTDIKRTVRKVSEKQSKLLGRYHRLRIAFLKKNPVCQIAVEGCTHKATEVHHQKGRGKYLLVEQFWKASCHNCHRHITEHSKEAIELGHSVSRLNKAS